MTTTEMRNSTPDNARPIQTAPGVGVRQGIGPTPPVGGGYQQNCIGLNFTPKPNHRDDPRFSDLRAIGMPPMWLDVAAEIGVDAFLAMWRVLDQHGGDKDPNTLEIRLRRFKSWQRQQRNSFIRELANNGIHTDEIVKRVYSQLGEKLGQNYVRALAKGK